jgi:hypothetical protein
MKKKLTAVAVAIGATAALSACTASAPEPTAAPQPATTTTAATRTIAVEGFPLDRSLDSLAASKVDAIVVLSGLQAQPATWLSEDGKAPNYMKTGEAPSEEEATHPQALVTPVQATIRQSLRGAATAGASLLFQVPGGTADGVTLDAGGEIGVAIDELLRNETLLVAGPIVDNRLGKVLDPHFVYAISADGTTATSLLESAGDNPHPTFTLAELEQRLAAG